MRGPMRLIDPTAGLMECCVCGHRHRASIRPGNGGPARYYRGSWRCSNERCPSKVEASYLLNKPALPIRPMNPMNTAVPAHMGECQYEPVARSAQS